MATLMSGSAVRLPRALPTWLRAGRHSPRDVAPVLGVTLLGAGLVWQSVSLLWTLIVPLSSFGMWQPQTAVIASPAERRALFISIDPFFRSAGQGAATATVTSAGLTLFGININEATGGGSPSGELSPEALKAGVGFTPRAEAGKVTGLVVQPQGDGAAFRAAGLRPGDVIRSVNGRSIGGAGDAASLAGQLVPGARVSLEVERGASVVPIALFLTKQ